MSESKFLFVFDTSFFWSLLNINRHHLIQDIAEIFEFIPNIEYVAPKVILKELSGKFKDKCVYLERYIHFSEISPSENEIRELKKLNLQLSMHAFEKEEIGDYVIIYAAQKYNSSNLVTFLVSNDEGIHLFLEKAIPEEKIKPIWVARFLSFLAKQSPSKEQRERLLKTAEMLEEYIETYRAKIQRGETPFYDIEKILLAANLQPREKLLNKLQETLEKQLITGENNSSLPSSFKSIISMIQQIYMYMDLEETNAIEELLESLEQTITRLTVEQQETVYKAISVQMVSILGKLASIYDQKGAFSGIVSALEREKVYFKYLVGYEDKSQLYAILSWIHLLNNSIDLSSFYYSKIENKNFELAKKLQALYTLINCPISKIGKEIYSLLSPEKWRELNETLSICPNKRLVEKIKYILESFDKPSFVFDARHFSIKNERLSENSLLFFLKEQLRVISVRKTENSVIIECYGTKIGSIELRLPKIDKLSSLTSGDLIHFSDGMVEKIRKPGPGKKFGASIYFLKLVEEDFEISQSSKLI